jgi:hypothetical protein
MVASAQNYITFENVEICEGKKKGNHLDYF